MTFPQGIETSGDPAVTGEKSTQYGAGFFFMAENTAAIYGNKSYLLFQTKGQLKLFRADGATLTELASFDAPTETGQNSEPAIPPIFHYQIQYTPATGEISVFRNDTFIGSYTDQSPLKSGQSIILMSHFTKTSFDNISVKAGTKTEVKAYNTHTDHLGSSSVITAGLTLNGEKNQQTGQIVQLLDQYPYGEKRIDENPSSISNSASPDEPTTTNISTFSTKKTFTGKELDLETGLYYYGARYYDSRLGRFISLDPASRNISEFQLFTNPQRFNSYSYSLNNPVRYQDPTGKSAVGATAEWILTGIGWVLAIIEPTPAGEIAMTMISAGKTTIFVVDTVQEGIEKFNKMADASTKNEKIGKGMAEAHKKGEAEGGSGGAEDQGSGQKNLKKDKNEDEIEKFFNNPSELKGKNPDELKKFAAEAKNSKWEVDTLRKGGHKGEGQILREMKNGKYTGKTIQWHPGEGHHGPDPYWKISSPEKGIIRVGPQFN